jgi:hypothetical protein
MKTLTAHRYVQPLREGGSLPAVVDTDDGLFVAKFRGAGQGPKALIAEIIAAGIARVLELPVPDAALIELQDEFGRSEPDPEIQELLQASVGINFGLRYLDGAFNFAVSAAGDVVSPALAARVVWLDAFLTNPDRTHRNTNILVWQRRPWLIDHGAALYAHHDWASVNDARTRMHFPLIRDHVLLALADDIDAADAELAPLVSDAAIATVLAAVPDSLLLDRTMRVEFPSAAAARSRYADYLSTRLSARRAFVAEAAAARAQVHAEAPRYLSARR